MGQNKAMLQVNGMPLIQHIHSQLTQRFDTIVISTNEKQKYTFLPCEIVPDETPGQGPLMAIYSVLRMLQQPVFVVATDIPEIPYSILDSLLSLARENPQSRAVVPVTANGDYEPLFALYRPELIPVIQAALSDGLRHIYGLFSRVPITRYTLKPGETLINLNHPRDYQRYIKTGI